MTEDERLVEKVAEAIGRSLVKYGPQDAAARAAIAAVREAENEKS